MLLLFSTRSWWHPCWLYCSHEPPFAVWHFSSRRSHFWRKQYLLLKTACIVSKMLCLYFGKNRASFLSSFPHLAENSKLWTWRKKKKKFPSIWMELWMLAVSLSQSLHPLLHHASPLLNLILGSHNNSMKFVVFHFHHSPPPPHVGICCYNIHKFKCQLHYLESYPGLHFFFLFTNLCTHSCCGPNFN